MQPQQGRFLAPAGGMAVDIIRLITQHEKFDLRRAAKEARAIEKELKRIAWEAKQREWRDRRLAREREEDQRQAGLD